MKLKILLVLTVYPAAGRSTLCSSKQLNCHKTDTKLTLGHIHNSSG